jgi:hypothetical protein
LVDRNSSTAALIFSIATAVSDWRIASLTESGLASTPNALAKAAPAA